MALPSEDTLVVGGKITAAWANADVRDAVNTLLNLPRVKAYQGTTPTTAGTSGTAQLILWDTEQYDTDSMHSTSVNTSRITIATSGMYDIKTSLYWVANATGYRQIEIRKNSGGSAAGGTQIAQFRAATSPTSSAWVGGDVDEPLVAGDYLECFATQTSGGSLATVVGQSFSWISARLVAA